MLDKKCSIFYHISSEIRLGIQLTLLAILQTTCSARRRPRRRHRWERRQRASPATAKTGQADFSMRSGSNFETSAERRPVTTRRRLRHFLTNSGFLASTSEPNFSTTNWSWKFFPFILTEQKDFNTNKSETSKTWTWLPTAGLWSIYLPSFKKVNYAGKTKEELPTKSCLVNNSANLERWRLTSRKFEKSSVRDVWRLPTKSLDVDAVLTRFIDFCNIGVVFWGAAMFS